MKIKNIMFSGVMASILMVGGASADIVKLTDATVGTSTKLTTEQYVRGGVKEAEDYADQRVTALSNTINDPTTGILKQAKDYTDELATGAVAANTAAIGTKNTAAAGTASNATGLYEYIDDAVAGAASGASSAINGLNADLSKTADGITVSLKETAGVIGDLNVSIADKGIAGAKIADSGIDTLQIKNGAVTSDKIGADAVTTAKIADGAVTTDQIGGKAVTAAKIADATITTTQIAANAGILGSQLSEDVQASLAKADAAAANLKALAYKDTVGTNEIDNLAVTGAKIANNTITVGKIATDDLATAWGSN